MARNNTQVRLLNWFYDNQHGSIQTKQDRLHTLPAAHTILQLIQSYVAFRKRLPVMMLIRSNKCHCEKVNSCITENFVQ